MFRSPLSYCGSTLLISFSLILLCGSIRVLHAEANRTPPGIGVDERVGDTVPLDTPLINESGERVLLGDFFKDGKPVILIPGYYTCPRLCTLVFNGVFNGADSVIPDGLVPGRDYHIVSLSFDSDDTPETAHKKGAVYRSRLQTKLASTNGTLDESGWTFLTGTPDSIADVMDAIGYRYRSDGEE
ncbi:MAG: SCO family protein, partial [Leptospiraceae bacterium]|nr:SCO family protein [Leptospiraceae bacterium]